MNICSIYKIINKVNNKVYIGQTWQLLKIRFQYHCYDTKNYISSIHNAIKKYGKNNFHYEILTVCSTQETADYWEKYFITRYCSMNNKYGYNLREGGSRGRNSEKTKEKLSKIVKGRKHSKESRFKISESHKGIYNHNYGKHLPEETKIKISLSRMGITSPRKGVKLSIETKNRISESKRKNKSKQ